MLDKNVKLLSKYNKDLAQKIANLSELTGNYEIKEAKSGDSILFANGIPVDDNDDPIWNALEKYKKLEEQTHRGITVIWGLGFGYVLKEFAKRYKGKIVVYEPNVELLRIAMELVDFSEELENKNIRITSNIEEVKQVYLDLFFLDYKLNIIPINFYEETANMQEKLEFKEQIEKVHGVYQSNYNNLMKKGMNWTLALFNNISSVYKHQDLHALKNHFKGKTAVIISAGPSLDKNIQDLLPYRDQVVVFCVGTALKTALKNGITPDFVVAIEVSPNTKKQLNVPEIADITLINATNIHKGVLDLKPKCFLNYHVNKEATSTWFGNILGAPISEYESAGTVSTIAMYSARIMGIDKMIFIGQDLAYTDNKCYSKDSIYGNYYIDDSKAVKSNNAESEVQAHKEMLNKDMHLVKGYYGDKVLSRSDLMLFIVYFEEIAEQYGSTTKLINATEGGAYIKGFEHISLKEALEKYANDTINTELPVSLVQLDSRNLKKRRDIVTKELKNIIKSCYEIDDLISPVVNSNIISSLSEQTRKEYADLKEILPPSYLKGLKRQHIEQDVIIQRRDKLKVFEDNFYVDLETLIEKAPNDFSINIRAVRDAYFSVKEKITNNTLVNNFNIRLLLIINNLIKNFNESEEDLVALYKETSTLLLFMHFYSAETIKYVKSILQEIEA